MNDMTQKEPFILLNEVQRSESVKRSEIPITSFIALENDPPLNNTYPLVDMV